MTTEKARAREVLREQGWRREDGPIGFEAVVSMLAMVMRPTATGGAEDVQAALADPNAVHVNMLRGAIAKPSPRQIIHIYGEEAIRAALSVEPASASGEVERRRLNERIGNLRDALEHCGKLVSDSPAATLGFVRRAAFRAIEEDDTAVSLQPREREEEA